MIFGWFLLYGFQFGFPKDISIEVLIQDRFSCSIRRCVPLPVSEYYMLGVVKRLGQCIIYEVQLGRYAIWNECAGSGCVIRLLCSVCRNVVDRLATVRTEAMQNLRPPMPGILWGFTNYGSRCSAVLEIDCHTDCNFPVVLQRSGIIQQAWYAVHDRAVRLFNDCIRLRWIGCRRILYYALWLSAFCECLGGILTASICTKSLHLLPWLLSSQSLPFYEYVNGFRLALHNVLICMPRGDDNEAQDISSFPDRCFQGIPYGWMHQLQWLSGVEGCGSLQLPMWLELHVAQPIALPSHLRRVGFDFRQDVQSLHNNVGQAVVPWHPLLCIVPRCMPRRQNCCHAAVAVADVGVFGWFQSLFQNAISNIYLINLRWRGNWFDMAILGIDTVVIHLFDCDIIVGELGMWDKVERRQQIHHFLEDDHFRLSIWQLPNQPNTSIVWFKQYDSIVSLHLFHLRSIFSVDDEHWAMAGHSSRTCTSDEPITGWNSWVGHHPMGHDPSGESRISWYFCWCFCSSVGRHWKITTLHAQAVVSGMPSPLAMTVRPQILLFSIILIISPVISVIPLWTCAAFNVFTAITTTFATLLCKEQIFWSYPILSLDCRSMFERAW